MAADRGDDARPIRAVGLFQDLGIAEAAGLPPAGGTQNGGASVRRSESPLGGWLRVLRGLQAARGGFFLRAETMHHYYS